jgi:hypothetical protein
MCIVPVASHGAVGNARQQRTLSPTPLSGTPSLNSYRLFRLERVGKEKPDEFVGMSHDPWPRAISFASPGNFARSVKAQSIPSTQVTE